MKTIERKKYVILLGVQKGNICHIKKYFLYAEHTKNRSKVERLILHAVLKRLSTLTIIHKIII